MGCYNKTPLTGSCRNRHLFLSVLEAGSQRSILAKYKASFEVSDAGQLEPMQPRGPEEPATI